MMPSVYRYCWAMAWEGSGRRPAMGQGQNPNSVAMGDFNGDGKLDLAVANEGYYSCSVSVLLGNGNGTFGGKDRLRDGAVSQVCGYWGS